jgi:D-alanine-D-alanine ligase
MARIEIVRTNLRGLSSLSLKSASGIEKALLTKHDDVVITTVDSVEDLNGLVNRNPDLVFLGMKYLTLGTVGKIWLAEYLNAHGIPSTGSGSLAHRLELDKSKAKTRVLGSGLVTSPFFVLKQYAERGDDLLNFPLFVKPIYGGGGLGVDGKSVVHSTKQLYQKVASIRLNHDEDSLVEQYLSGREFSVAILRNEDGNHDILPIELIAPLNKEGSRLLSSVVKSADAEQALEITDKVLESRISTLAMAVFESLGAKDYGRIDIRLDEFGTPNFLEANLIPCLIANYGSFPKACMLHKSLGHTEMINHIADLALTHQPEPIITV